MSDRRPIRNRKGDWVAVLEATYSLTGDDQQWLDRLLGSVAREHWPGRTSAAFTFDLSKSKVAVRDVAVHGPPEVHQAVRTLMSGSSGEVIDKLFRDTAVGTVSERIFAAHPDQAAFFHANNHGTASDILGVVCHSGSGERGVVLNLALDAPRRSKPIERRQWTRCAAHIGAGLRLRRILPELATLDAAPIEAILDGGGKLHDARDAASGRAARDLLRSAVFRVDRARSAAGRRDPDGALQEWEALVHGRWSLVDRFDSDGRRFVVAIRNDPRFPDPRGLSLRERQVAEFVGLGRSAKEIAYLLGVPATSVENSTRRAQAKLGLTSRVELTAFFAPQGLRTQLATVGVAGDALLIGATPLLDGAKLANLTEAERATLALLIAGSTNNDIAARRMVSPRTVANQVQAVFRKLGARSRSDLMARLSESATPSSVGN